MTLLRFGICNNETKYVEDEKMRHVVEKTFKERKERQEFTGRYRKENTKNNLQPVLFNCD
ncbi:MAG: hypothetical protein HY796_05700 [Elusimicrobia bacterium]|nr:hypothetical protein [Elusimicrobiota bacterium]